MSRFMLLVIGIIFSVEGAVLIISVSSRCVSLPIIAMVSGIAWLIIGGWFLGVYCLAAKIVMVEDNEHKEAGK